MLTYNVSGFEVFSRSEILAKQYLLWLMTVPFFLLILNLRMKVYFIQLTFDLALSFCAETLHHIMAAHRCNSLILFDFILKFFILFQESFLVPVSSVRLHFSGCFFVFQEYYWTLFSTFFLATNHLTIEWNIYGNVFLDIFPVFLSLPRPYGPTPPERAL